MPPIAPHLRRATLEIDRVPLSEWPDTDDGGATWRSIFDEVGWDTAAYVRTAAHELEHAMGLWHSSSGNSIVRTTTQVAAAATPATPFPGNIVISFAPDDRHRLRHWPDIVVRPGTSLRDGRAAPIGR